MYKRQGQYRQRPPIIEQALEDTLLSISNMVCELPWVRELSIDPLLIDENGAVASAARMVIDLSLIHI